MGAFAQTVVRMPCQEGIDADHDEDRLARHSFDFGVDARDEIIVVAGAHQQRSDPFAKAEVAAHGSCTHARSKVIRNVNL